MHLNHEKAREYFSAYHEGTLERGLKETFERALRMDAQVQAEYRAFERLMGALGGLKAEVPEPEFDLHEAIARRLDKHLYDESRRTKHPVFAWWKSVALGGLATVALIAAVLQVRSNTGDSSQANFVPVTGVTDRVELLSKDGEYKIRYATQGQKTIVLRASDGSVLEQQTLNNGSLTCPIVNPNAAPALIQIEISGDKAQTIVALPGTRVQTITTGEGSVKEFAQALAGYYHVPVFVNIGQDAQLRWELEPGDGLAAAEKTLKGTKYSAQKNPDGVLSIQAN